MPSDMVGDSARSRFASKSSFSRVSVPFDRVISVIQVVQVRLLPTPEQASALADTLRTCNAAASWLPEQMCAHQIFRKFVVQKSFYAQLRERFGLSAQPAIRVIGKTCDAYSALRANLNAGNYGPPGSNQRRKIEGTPDPFSS